MCVVKAQLKLTLKLDEDDADDEKKCIPMKWNQFSTELHSYDIKPLIQNPQAIWTVNSLHEYTVPENYVIWKGSTRDIIHFQMMCSRFSFSLSLVDFSPRSFQYI